MEMWLRRFVLVKSWLAFSPGNLRLVDFVWGHGRAILKSEVRWCLNSTLD